MSGNDADDEDEPKNDGHKVHENGVILHELNHNENDTNFIHSIL